MQPRAIIIHTTVLFLLVAQGPSAASTLPCTSAMCTLEGALYGGPCDDVVPTSIRSALIAAGSDLDRAGGESPMEAKHLRRQASSILDRADRMTTHAEKGGRAAPSCAAALRAAIDAVRTTAGSPSM